MTIDMRWIDMRLIDCYVDSREIDRHEIDRSMRSMDHYVDKVMRLIFHTHTFFKHFLYTFHTHFTSWGILAPVGSTSSIMHPQGSRQQNSREAEGLRGVASTKTSNPPLGIGVLGCKAPIIYYHQLQLAPLAPVSIISSSWLPQLQLALLAPVGSTSSSHLKCVYKVHVKSVCKNCV